jgi:hypothetical protein
MPRSEDGECGTNEAVAAIGHGTKSTATEDATASNSRDLSY